MTIPKEAIEKAIEGGWKFLYSFERLSYEDECAIALDPSFWQSLGKALGGKEDYNGMYHGRAGSWRSNAINFYDLNLTGGDTDAYWKALLIK